MLVVAVKRGIALGTVFAVLFLIAVASLDKPDPFGIGHMFVIASAPFGVILAVTVFAPLESAGLLPTAGASWNFARYSTAALAIVFNWAVWGLVIGLARFGLGARRRARERQPGS